MEFHIDVIKGVTDFLLRVATDESRDPALRKAAAANARAIQMAEEDLSAAVVGGLALEEILNIGDGEGGNV